MDRRPCLPELFTSPEVNRCFAVSLYRMATEQTLGAIYVSAESGEGCCPGGLAHTGYHPEPEDIRYFVSTGKKNSGAGLRSI